MSKYPIVAGVMYMPDGREVCQPTKIGRVEYQRRLGVMAIRQNFLCAICGQYPGFAKETFDHQDGRGSGGSHRDDRIEIDGKWHNAALCSDCNTRKGSVRYHWQDGLYVPVNQK